MARPSPLRPVEADPPGPPQSARGNGGGNGGYGERLARIETRMDYVATREDIAKLKAFMAEKDPSRSKRLIGIMVAVVIALVSASIVVTVAMLKIPAGTGQ